MLACKHKCTLKKKWIKVILYLWTRYAELVWRTGSNSHRSFSSILVSTDSCEKYKQGRFPAQCATVFNRQLLTSSLYFLACSAQFYLELSCWKQLLHTVTRWEQWKWIRTVKWHAVKLQRWVKVLLKCCGELRDSAESGVNFLWLSHGKCHLSQSSYLTTCAVAAQNQLIAWCWVFLPAAFPIWPRRSRHRSSRTTILDAFVHHQPKLLIIIIIIVIAAAMLSDWM